MTPQEFKAWREQMGWSQAQAAAALGLDLRNLQRREAGDAKISIETLLACIALDAGRRHEMNDVRLAERLLIADKMPGRGRPSLDRSIAART